MNEHATDRGPESAGADLVDRARLAGFAFAGVCSLEPSAYADELHAWLATGKHGSMGYLAEHAELRTDPARLLEGARSALVVADVYHTRADDDDAALAPGQGRVARYARGRDYHRVIKKRLHGLCDALRETHPGERFRACVDTAPVPERELAQRAGLGWIGKHTLLIHPRGGSWVLLGVVLTTLDADPPAGQETVADHCGTCTRCIDACPTDAITPYSVDARRCISYLTIERREAIDQSLHAGMGGWIFGCDICQEVCPHNSPRDREALPTGAQRRRPEYEPTHDRFDLLEVLGWDEKARRAAFERSAMKRAALSLMRRNAAIASGNALRQGDPPGLRARMESIAQDPGEDALVRDAARAVVDRPGSGGG